jgi:hypothetical protein
MKKFFKKAFEFFIGANVHASHFAIKGSKSGGRRDVSTGDWYA